MTELCVITTYFNPGHHASLRQNYDLFMQGMRRAGVLCVTVECAFGEDSFELTESLDVVHVRTQSLLWQKERLINLAASWLPRNCKYVAWIDCDITFDNRHWARDLVRVLQSHKIAQVFETCMRLDSFSESGSKPDETLNIINSFASVMKQDPERLHTSRYDGHRYTGYGWAMHREIFDSVGLYESVIGGSANHYLAHAIFGEPGFCIDYALNYDPNQISHLQAWSKRFHDQVQGSLGVVPGNIRRLSSKNALDLGRTLFFCSHKLTELGFNPLTDLNIAPGEPIEWAKNMDKPLLKQYITDCMISHSEG